MVGYAYVVEFFIAWYSGNPFEAFAFYSRALGPYAWAYWIMVSCNVVAPQFFWFKKCRQNLWVMMAVCLAVNVGMWMERFVITVTSLSADFLPSSWGYFSPTIVDILMLAGSFGLFITLFLLFVRYLPIVAMAEVKSVMPQAPLVFNGHRGLGDYWGDMPQSEQQPPDRPAQDRPSQDRPSPDRPQSERPPPGHSESEGPE